MLTLVTFDAELPPIPQNDAWSCAPTSLRWALRAMGRNPSEAWVEDHITAEGVVSEQFGLMDSTGAGLAAFVSRHWGEFGFDANNEPLISFDFAAREGGHAYPLLIGGRAWNHWSALRGYDAANDLLLLANPAHGHMGVAQTMSRDQFRNLGTFSMVRVFHPHLLA